MVKHKIILYRIIFIKKLFFKETITYKISVKYLFKYKHSTVAVFPKYRNANLRSWIGYDN